MPGDLLATLANPVVAIPLALMLAVVGAVVWRERQETESAPETARRSADRISGALGGVLGVLAVLLVSAGNAAAEAGVGLADVLSHDPEAIAALGAGLFGWLSLRGSITVSPRMFLAFVALATIVAVVWSRRER
jgi:hypothetical protein